MTKHPHAELAGVKFPMPVQTEPKRRQTYYIPDPSSPTAPFEMSWAGSVKDKKALATSMIQLNKRHAIQQSKAMAAALKQAIEKAKEQMK